MFTTILEANNSTICSWIPDGTCIEDGRKLETRYLPTGISRANPFPPPSLPRANGTNPAATDAAEPFELPQV